MMCESQIIRYILILTYHYITFLCCFQKENGGIIMVNFFPEFVKCSPNASISDVAGESSSAILTTHPHEHIHATISAHFCCCTCLPKPNNGHYLHI